MPRQYCGQKKNRISIESIFVFLTSCFHWINKMSEKKNGNDKSSGWSLCNRKKHLVRHVFGAYFAIHIVRFKAFPFYHITCTPLCLHRRRRAVPCLLVIPFKFQYTIWIRMWCVCVCSRQRTKHSAQSITAMAVWRFVPSCVRSRTTKRYYIKVARRYGSGRGNKVKQKPKTNEINWTKFTIFVCSSHGQTFFNSKLYTCPESFSFQLILCGSEWEQHYSIFLHLLPIEKQSFDQHIA